MAPWTHVFLNPDSSAKPCCIGQGDFGNYNDTPDVDQLINNPQMNKLRLDMLNGVENPACENCYVHERQGIRSLRNVINNDQQEYVQEVDKTNLDGSITEFKMRYFDFRFSNICNMKCRSCGSWFSSLWEQEDIKTNKLVSPLTKINNKPALYKDIEEHIDNFNVLYFAGGEPLITDDHYTVLEDLIRRNKTDVVLRYSTNLSVLKFKDKDLLNLWSKFKKNIEVYASIDHYGERAEYIRHGTDWGVVESNLHIVKKLPNITFRINSVLGIYNYLTFGDFYMYLIKQGLYNPNDNLYTIWNLSNPDYMNAQCLPKNLKSAGKKNLQQLLGYMHHQQFPDRHKKELLDTITWVDSADLWEQNKHQFKTETTALDKIRGEDFVKVFPELIELME
jgi:MoaA/NifB/PqqE/SkfB family radical SAM enzyme